MSSATEDGMELRKFDPLILSGMEGEELLQGLSRWGDTSDVQLTEVGSVQ
jgi:hypothetical protein